ncbi:MAG: hypothetical protein JKX97_03900, partial [Candidatus Lindowbacteria bacterium]|nr:hypothetical protein [Candidatus Lindowbacteria bacterium]
SSTSGFPIISKIPIIGKLFGRHVRENRQSTLVIYLTAHVVDTYNEVAENYQKRDVEVEEDALTGDRFDDRADENTI